MSEAANRRRIGIVAGLVFIVGGSAWAYYRLRPEPVDPKVAEVKELSQQLASAMNGQNVPPEQGKELLLQLVKANQQLDQDQRGKTMKVFMDMFQQQADKYFALSPEEQVAFIDGQIDQMETIRGWMESLRKLGSLTSSLMNRGGTSNSPSTQPAGDAARPSAEEQMRRFNEILDSTTPEQRARLGEYFRQMNDRRQQRGLATGAWR